MPQGHHDGNGEAGPSAWVRDLRLSLGFLTRLPVAPPMDAGSMAAAMRVFPLAGALVGLLSGLVIVVTAWLGLPPLAAALAGIGAGLALTGALHEDGLADMADGLGGRDRDDSLAIMRDSRIGSYGVLALVLIVGLKASALAALLAAGGGRWPAVLAVMVAAGALSRAVLPVLLHALPPARGDGLSVLAGTPSASSASIAAILAWAVSGLSLLPHSLVLGLIGLPLAAATGVLFVGLLASRRLGGQTGDVVGAAQAIAETLCLLLAAAYLNP